MARLLLQQGQAVFKRVTRGVLRQFIHEGFSEKSLAGMLYATPVTQRDRRPAGNPAYLLVSDRVGNQRGFTVTVQADVRITVQPGQGFTPGVQLRFEAADFRRAVVIMAYVLFPGPDQLDRVGHAHGGMHRVPDKVAAERSLAPETPAHLVRVDDDVLHIHGGSLGSQRPCAQRVLHAGPQLKPSVAAPGNTIHGFHGGMGQKRHAIFGPDRPGRRRHCPGNVPRLMIGDKASTVQGRVEVTAHALRTELTVAAVTELHGQPGKRLVGAPVVVRCHNHGAGDLQYVLHPGQGLDGTRINRDDISAKNRRVTDSRNFHVVQAEVDGVNRGAGHLIGQIDARHRFAAQDIVLFCFQPGIERGFELRGSRSQVGKAGRQAACIVIYVARFRTAIRLRHLPAPGGGPQQHLLRSGAGDAHTPLPRKPDTGAPAGQLQVHHA